jgi:hypothetical protein
MIELRSGRLIHSAVWTWAHQRQSPVNGGSEIPEIGPFDSRASNRSRSSAKLGRVGPKAKEGGHEQFLGLRLLA